MTGAYFVYCPGCGRADARHRRPPETPRLPTRRPAQGDPMSPSELRHVPDRIDYAYAPDRGMPLLWEGDDS